MTIRRRHKLNADEAKRSALHRVTSDIHVTLYVQQLRPLIIRDDDDDDDDFDDCQCIVTIRLLSGTFSAAMYR